MQFLQQKNTYLTNKKNRRIDKKKCKNGHFVTKLKFVVIDLYNKQKKYNYLTLNMRGYKKWKRI